MGVVGTPTSSNTTSGGGGGGGGSEKKQRKNFQRKASSDISASTSTSIATSNSTSNNNNNNNNNNSNNNNNDPASAIASTGVVLDDCFKSIVSKTMVLHQPQVTLTCYIPTHTVGAVIGRRGTTIAQIQRQAQQATGGPPVRVSIVGHHESTTTTTTSTSTSSNGLSDDNNMNQNNNDYNNNNNAANTTTLPQPSTNNNNNNNNNNFASNNITNSGSNSVPYTYSELDWSSPHWTPVVVRADPCAALIAGQKLQELVEGDMDDVILDCPISWTKHATLIGHSGIVIQTLSADTNVRIMIPRRELQQNIIQLEGQLDNVKSCLDRAMTILNDSCTNNNKHKDSSSGNTTTPPPPTTTTTTATGNNNRNNTNNNNNNSSKNNSNKKQQQQQQQAQPLSQDNTKPFSKSITVLQIPAQQKLKAIGRKSDTIIKKQKQDDEWQVTIHGNNMDQIESVISILTKWDEENSNRTDNSSNNTNINNNNSNNNNGNDNSNRRGRKHRPRPRVKNANNSNTNKNGNNK